MTCPNCHQPTRVSNSRQQAAGFSTWRRRVCLQCQTAFTTSEQILPESIIKCQASDGTLTPLQAQDIYLSVYHALKGLENASTAAHSLTQTCLDKIFQQRGVLIQQRAVEQLIFATLQAYQPLAGYRYLLNDLQRLPPALPDAA